MNDFSNIGYGLLESSKKKIDLFYRVNGTLVIIFITILFIDLAVLLFTEYGLAADLLRSIAVVGICFINILLNRFGYFRIGRLLLLYLLPLLILFFVPVATGKVVTDYYFWYPYIPVAASVLPYYFFPEESEKKWHFFTLGYYLLILLITDNVLSYFANDNLTILTIVDENALFYKISPAFIFVFINITLYNVFKMLRDHERNLIHAKELLHKKNVELETKNAELNKTNGTKDKFFHIIGHDLRSPIAQLIQIAHLLNDDEIKLPKEKYKQVIKALADSSSHSYNLLNDLFNWAQTQTGEIVFTPTTFNLFELIEENIQLNYENARFKNISIVNRVPKSCEVYADMNMLNTIFRNLLSNAIKFTYHNGEIEINSNLVPGGIEVSVRDNGKGISLVDLDKLFKIDTKLSARGTDDEKGTGLGLVLCKEFIDYHKGRIWVTSEPEKGSTFTFFLPQNGKRYTQ
ncbi:MAG: HAMP domain-containing histidine kinase [Bacteroidales bacterium]|nr:HAMP domain-containing histidine kinase [Bacteroidales bacterium]